MRREKTAARRSEGQPEGMMVFIPAGCVHGCNSLAACSWSYQMLHLSATGLRRLMTERTGSTDRFIGEREIRVVEMTGFHIDQGVGGGGGVQGGVGTRSKAQPAPGWITGCRRG